MNVLGVILARAGSKGLPGKCVREVLGRPLIAYTFDHAKESRLLTDLVLTTDSEPAKRLARREGITAVDRPPELATDTATVDSAARHAAEVWERERGAAADVVVLLYANIPVRAAGLIDRAVEQLIRTRADSVRSVAPAAKQHPDWLHRLDGDRMTQYRPNSIYRRQDLEPLFYHDGAVAAVTRGALFGALETPNDHQAFLGRDRRALVQGCADAVDVDEPVDLYVAEACLRPRSREGDVNDGQPHPAVVSPVAIGRRRIGPGEPVFIVAEAGVNHNGSVEVALRMVDAAAAAGAHAVKFQMFRAADLVTASAPTAVYQRDGGEEESQRAMLSRLELSQHEFGQIKERCAEKELVFLATPFTEADLKRLIELNVGAVKIASTDLTNAPLLEAVAASGLPLILSTGASSAEEIHAAVGDLRRLAAGDRLALLHCVSCYPTPTDAINLRAIDTLRRTFGVPCGLSDHTTSKGMGGWAAAAGACILEKHFTLDRSATGPDHAMSLDPEQLSEYTGEVREVERALGAGRLGMTELESEVRAVAGKSVVAAEDIPRGTRLTREMLALKRPGTGIAPGDLERLVGRCATIDLPRDTLLAWNMVR